MTITLKVNGKSYWVEKKCGHPEKELATGVGLHLIDF
jgi:hypothetical protein